MVSHNYIKASKAAAAVITILLLIVGGGDVYSARAINYSSSSKQLRHRRQDTPADKKTATPATAHEQRGLNSYNNDGYDTNSIFKTEEDTRCTRSITKDDGNCIMKCQTTTFVYTHDDILLDKTVSENVRECTYDEEEIMALESDEGSSTRVDDDWRDGGGNDDSWKCSPRKRTWQVRKMREREMASGVVFAVLYSLMYNAYTCS